MLKILALSYSELLLITTHYSWIVKKKKKKKFLTNSHFSLLFPFSLLSSLFSSQCLWFGHGFFFFSLSLMVRWSQCSVLGSWWWVTVRFLFFLSFYFCCCLWLRWIWLVVGGSDGRWMWWLCYRWMDVVASSIENSWVEKKRKNKK